MKNKIPNITVNLNITISNKVREKWSIVMVDSIKANGKIIPSLDLDVYSIPPIN